MKSYIRFLSRNKFYAAIQFIGLSVSLAFVLLISCYVWQNLRVLSLYPDTERIYSVSSFMSRRLSSLSDTLLGFDGVSEELRNGLETISESSKGLIRFVDSYRNLTRVAAPVKKAFYFRALAERVISLTREQAVVSGAVCTYEEKSEDILLYADEGQITQILINLIRNAIQADARKIVISAEINLSEQVVIDVCNDGQPISQESREEIFVPFYTTKQEGTGIGLSLSRQIMRLHNGNLKLTRSDSKSTVFTLIFR